MPINVVAAPVAERDQCTPTLLAAFASDPLTQWMLPDPSDYRTYFARVLEPFAGGAFDHGAAYRSDDFKGVALWLPPGVHSDEEAMGAVMQEALSTERQGEVFGFFEELGKSHPQYDHWYLPVIGVDPTCQGMGYGSALLAHSLEVCDRDHLPAYLESSNPRNIPLYERFGFEVQGEIQFATSPPVAPMLRAAR